MSGPSGTLTSLTQLHVPELEHLYEVSIGTPHRPTRDGPSAGHVSEATLRDSPRAVTSELALESKEAQLVWSQEMMAFL